MNLIIYLMLHYSARVKILDIKVINIALHAVPYSFFKQK